MSEPTRTQAATFLDRILAHKADEVAARRQQVALATLEQRAKTADDPRDFIGVLRAGEHVSLIAEVKKASPSKGVLIEHFDPVALAMIYAENGAAAISVLTDEAFFQGHLDYLTMVRDAVNVPVLRKDFVIDPYQVVEARAAGADAVLLIVAALDDLTLASLHQAVLDHGMAALVEVHDEAELERALAIDALLIGVNNRDLFTFEVDLSTTGRLAALVPDTVTLIGESGIRHGQHVAEMGAMGTQAVLVGERLVTADDTAAMVRELSTQPRQQSEDEA